MKTWWSEEQPVEVLLFPYMHTTLIIINRDDGKGNVLKYILYYDIVMATSVLIFLSHATLWCINMVASIEIL